MVCLFVQCSSPVYSLLLFVTVACLIEIIHLFIWSSICLFVLFFIQFVVTVVCLVVCCYTEGFFFHLFVCFLVCYRCLFDRNYSLITNNVCLFVQLFVRSLFHSCFFLLLWFAWLFDIILSFFHLLDYFLVCLCLSLFILSFALQDFTCKQSGRRKHAFLSQSQNEHICLLYTSQSGL